MKKRKIFFFSSLILLVAGTGASALNLVIPSELRSKIPAPIANVVEKFGNHFLNKELDRRQKRKANQDTSSIGSAGIGDPLAASKSANEGIESQSVLNGNDISSEIAQQQVIDQISQSSLSKSSQNKTVKRLVNGAQTIKDIATTVLAGGKARSTQDKVNALLKVNERTAHLVKSNGDKQEQIITQTAATASGVNSINKRETLKKLKDRRLQELKSVESVNTGIFNTRQNSGKYY